MIPAPLVTQPEVQSILRVGRARLYTIRRTDPAFPKPIAMSERPLKWLLTDIEAYLEKQ